MSWILALPVHAWRVASRFAPPRCRYHPSCSRYALDALAQHGPLRGTILAAWRVLRCNPWSLGGVDHACDQRLFPLSSRDRRLRLRQRRVS